MKLLARASTVGMRNCPGCESSNLPCMIDRMAGIVTVREQFERLGFIVGHVGERPVLTLKVDASTWPSWTGTEQKRNISLSGDELKWSLAASVGGTAEVVLRRVK
jgi:hypothetical protein